MESVAQKHNQKQKAENSRFQSQIGNIKEIRIELEQAIIDLTFQVDNVERQLGINKQLKDNNYEPADY